ncbi:hypothetical protein [Paenibacillus sp. NPDC058071]
MKEFIGYCALCKKPLYCLDGFLDGIVRDDKSAICFVCASNGSELADKE